MKIVDKIKTVLSRLLISGIDPKRYELRFSVHNYYVANTIYNIVSKAREEANNARSRSVEKNSEMASSVRLACMAAQPHLRARRRNFC